MLDDERIAAICANRIARSTGALDSNLESERLTVRKSYNGETPTPVRKGTSKYVSTDTFDAVESLQAQLVETFCGTLKPVRFQPQGPEDVEPARQATETVAYVVERQNKGFKLKEDMIKDGLMARLGVVKAWWEDSEDESEEEFDGTEEALASYMASNPDVTPTEVTLDETGAVNGATLTRKNGTSRVRVEAIPPEEFGVTSGTRRLSEADMVFHRTRKTRAELRAMGIKPDVVEELQTGTDWLFTVDARSRSNDADPDPFGNDDNDQKAGERIEVFECFTKLSMDDEGVSKRRLWRVVVAGNKVLEKEEAKRIPFIIFSPLHQSHTIWAPNYAQKVIPVQNARTALTRSIIDHAVQTTVPRYTVLRNGLPKPDELTDARPGGIVNINRENAVQPLPQAGLNPFVFQTREILAEDKEQITGVSRLSQGLNKDAVSRQNSGEMVTDLVNLSQVRQKVVARRFAEALAELYLEVYQLLLENQQGPLFVEIAGSWTQVDPRTWKPREHMWIDFALGFGEKKSEAEKYVKIDQYFAHDPSLAKGYDPEHRYVVISRALEAMGVADVNAIYPDPKSMPPQQPSPGEQLQLAKVQAEVADLNARAKLSETRAAMEVEKTQFQHQIAMGEMQIKLAELKLKQDRLAHDQLVAAAELRMAHEAQAQGNASAIISPAGR